MRVSGLDSGNPAEAGCRGKVRATGTRQTNEAKSPGLLASHYELPHPVFIVIYLF